MKLYLSPLLGRHVLSKLTPQHVRAFLRQKIQDGLSPRTVQLSLVILKKALGQAVNDRVLARNVAKLADGPRVQRFEGKTLSPEQVRALLDAAGRERLESRHPVAFNPGDPWA